MPGPDASNRERLLRLIDGGADAVREVERERSAKAVEMPAASQPETVRDEALKQAAAKTPVASAAPSKAMFTLPVGRSVWILLAAVLISSGFLLRGRFVPPPAKASEAASSTPQQLAPSVSDETAIGLRLVGVDTSEPPVALLEDLSTGKTYFAHKNDKIKNVRVKEIHRKMIEVSVDGRTVELR